MKVKGGTKWKGTERRRKNFLNNHKHDQGRDLGLGRASHISSSSSHLPLSCFRCGGRRRWRWRQLLLLLFWSSRTRSIDRCVDNRHICVAGSCPFRSCIKIFARMRPSRRPERTIRRHVVGLDEEPPVSYSNGRHHHCCPYSLLPYCLPAFLPIYLTSTRQNKKGIKQTNLSFKFQARSGLNLVNVFRPQFVTKSRPLRTLDGFILSKQSYQAHNIDTNDISSDLSWNSMDSPSPLISRLIWFIPNFVNETEQKDQPTNPSWGPRLWLLLSLVDRYFVPQIRQLLLACHALTNGLLGSQSITLGEEHQTRTIWWKKSEVATDATAERNSIRTRQEGSRVGTGSNRLWNLNEVKWTKKKVVNLLVSFLWTFLWLGLDFLKEAVVWSFKFFLNKKDPKKT